MSSIFDPLTTISFKKKKKSPISWANLIGFSRREHLKEKEEEEGNGGEGDGK